MTRFWEPLPDERARELVSEWGAVPVSERWPVIVGVAQGLDRRGRPFEALALLSAACEETSDQRAIFEMSSAAGDVAVNASEPLAAIAAAKVARRAAEELNDSELDPRWQRILGHALGDLGHVVEDPHVQAANQSRKPLKIEYEFCEAAKCIDAIAETVLNTEVFKNDRKESCFEDLMGALKRTVVGV